MFLTAISGAAQAADIQVLSSNPMKEVIDDLGPKLERATGHRLLMAWGKGAARPDISSPDALRRALLAAKSITYSNPAGGGSSGIHFAKVLDALGISDVMRPKTAFRAGSGPVAVLVASGEVEIGVQQLQELLPVADIDVVRAAAR